MATTRLRDRLFAAFGALLFFVSAVAFTVFIIIDTVQKKDAEPAQSACVSNHAEETLPAPEPYRPEGGSVTSLQTTDLQPGRGKTAASGSCLIMKYYGTLADNGTMFDENYTKPTGLAFTLGSKQVITGWEQGLVGMKEGGVRRLVIPPALAYGEQGTGAIPPNATLVFTVKLVRIQ